MATSSLLTSLGYASNNISHIPTAEDDPLNGYVQRIGSENTFSNAVARGTDQMQTALYGFTKAIGDTLGVDAISKWSQSGIENNIQEILANPPEVKDWDDVNSLAEFGTYFLQAIGEQVPQLAVDIPLLVGGALAAAPTGGASAAGALATRAAIGKALKRKLGERAYINFKKAAIAAPTVSLIAQGVGETKLEQDAAGADSDLLTWTTGVAKGLLDKAGLDAVVTKSIKAGVTPGDLLSTASGVAKTMGVAGLVEASTEATQTLLDKTALKLELGDQYELLSDDNLHEIKESALKGGMVGGAMAGGITGMQLYSEYAKSKKETEAKNLAKFFDEALHPEPEATMLEAPTQLGGGSGAEDKEPEQHEQQPLLPEPLENIEAQLDALLDPASDKKVVEIVRGNPLPTRELPEDMLAIPTQAGVALTRDQDIAQKILDRGGDERVMGEVLYGSPDGKNDTDGTVVQGLDEQGRIVYEELSNPARLGQSVENAKRQVPRGDVRITNSEKAMTERADKLLATSAPDLSPIIEANSKMGGIWKKAYRENPVWLQESLGELMAKFKPETKLSLLAALNDPKQQRVAAEGLLTVLLNKPKSKMSDGVNEQQFAPKSPTAAAISALENAAEPQQIEDFGSPELGDERDSQEHYDAWQQEDALSDFSTVRDKDETHKEVFAKGPLVSADQAAKSKHTSDRHRDVSKEAVSHGIFKDRAEALEMIPRLNPDNLRKLKVTDKPVWIPEARKYGFRIIETFEGPKGPREQDDYFTDVVYAAEKRGSERQGWQTKKDMPEEQRKHVRNAYISVFNPATGQEHMMSTLELTTGGMNLLTTDQIQGTHEHEYRAFGFLHSLSRLVSQGYELNVLLGKDSKPLFKEERVGGKIVQQIDPNIYLDHGILKDRKAPVVRLRDAIFTPEITRKIRAKIAQLKQEMKEPGVSVAKKNALQQEVRDLAERLNSSAKLSAILDDLTKKQTKVDELSDALDERGSTIGGLKKAQREVEDAKAKLTKKRLTDAQAKRVQEKLSVLSGEYESLASELESLRKDTEATGEDGIGKKAKAEYFARKEELAPRLKAIEDQIARGKALLRQMPETGTARKTLERTLTYFGRQVARMKGELKRPMDMEAVAKKRKKAMSEADLTKERRKYIPLAQSVDFDPSTIETFEGEGIEHMGDMNAQPEDGHTDAAGVYERDQLERRGEVAKRGIKWKSNTEPVNAEEKQRVRDIQQEIRTRQQDLTDTVSELNAVDISSEREASVTALRQKIKDAETEIKALAQEAEELQAKIERTGPPTAPQVKGLGDGILTQELAFVEGALKDIGLPLDVSIVEMTPDNLRALHDNNLIDANDIKFLQDGFKNGKKGAFVARGKEGFIVIPPMPKTASAEERAQRLWVIGHELGHGVMNAALANATPAQRQALERKFAGQKKKSKAYRDSEYGYGEWAADQFSNYALNRATRPDPELRPLFARVARYLEKLWSHIAAMAEKSPRFKLHKPFEQFIQELKKDGVFAKATTFGIGERAYFTPEQLAEANRRKERNLKAMGGMVQKLYESPVTAPMVKGFVTGVQELDFFLGDTGKKISKLFYWKHNAKHGGVRPYFEQVKEAQERYIWDFLKRMGMTGKTPKYTAAELKLAFDQLTQELPDGQLSEAAQELRTYLKEFHDRFIKATLPLAGEVGDYFPRQYHTEEIERRVVEFAETLTSHGVKNPDVVIGNLLSAKDIDADELVASWNPSNKVNHARVLTDPELVRELVAKGFLNPNPVETLLTYFHGVIQAGVHENMFGGYRYFPGVKKNKTLNKMREKARTPEELEDVEQLENLKERRIQEYLAANNLESLQQAQEWKYVKYDAEGELQIYNRSAKLRAMLENGIRSEDITPEQADRIHTIVSGFQGKLGTTLNPKFAAAQSNAMAITNWLTLGLSAVSSLAEGAMLFKAVKDVGNYKMAWRGILSAIKNRDELIQVYGQMGMVEHHLQAQVVSAMYGYHNSTNFSRKANDLLFKVNGQHWLTQTMRLAAAHTGAEFILHHARKAVDGDQVSARHLKMLGLTEPQVVLQWDEAGRPAWDMRTNDRMARVVQAGISRFVQDSVMVPNRAERPVWGNDPRFALFWHLHSFAYALSGMVLGAGAREAQARFKEGGLRNMAEFVVPTAIVLLAFAAVMNEIREEIQYRLGGDYRPSDHMDTGDYLSHLVHNRIGIGGVPKMYYEALTNKYDSMFGPLAFSPTLSKAGDLLDSESLLDFAMDATPFLSQNPGAQWALERE